MQNSLWGEAFNVKPDVVKTKKIIDKVNNPKKPRVVKSKSAESIELRLASIEENVRRILGVYTEDTEVIKTEEQMINFFDIAIKNNVIAIDTETNNSLDPITCKLMGPCFYTPGQKNVYIPVNHVDKSDNRFEWQITEEQIAKQLKRLENVFVIMHNGKFDYQVLKCTTGVSVHVDWDTYVGAKILDENELAGLKAQYISKIDPSIEKYDIEHLFAGLEYAIIDPEVFALYAATDPFMTYKLYEYQLKEYQKPGNERLFKLFTDIEMPMVRVTGDMELQGIHIDLDYAEKLRQKYQEQINEVDVKLQNELLKYNEIVLKWRQTPEANVKAVNNVEKGTYKKSKNEQLKDPIELTSPTQLAILLYDILSVGVIDKKKPRSTDEGVLSKVKLPLCELILQKRALVKLMSTYIEALPASVNSKTGKIHAKFNQCGAGTGRLSSSSPNLQNIPSHEKSIRLLFVSSNEIRDVTESDDSWYYFKPWEEIKSWDDWVFAKDIKIGDFIDKYTQVADICKSENKIKIKFNFLV